MLNYEYPPLGGGQGNANKYIFDELISQYPDVYVDLIASSKDNDHSLHFNTGNQYFLDVGKKSKNLLHQNSYNLILNCVRSLKLSLKLCRINKYEVIIAWGGIPSGYIAWILKSLYKIRYIVLLRGSDVPFHEQKWFWLDTLFFQFTTPFVWKNANKVIANSVLLKQTANFIAPNQTIKVITNGVDTEFFIPNSKSGHQELIILAVGRLSKIKGYDILIRAVSMLDIKFKLWIVGDGSEIQNLKQLTKELDVESKIHFFGHIGKNELLLLYQQATLFCITSHNEGMSNAMLEAMSCGLPIISTDIGGSTELVQGNGIIIRKNSIDDLYHAIKKLVNNKKLLSEYSYKSREIALSFDWKNITKELVDSLGI